MKILFIHDYPPTEGGGVEVQTYQDARALVEKGCDVAIATTRFVSETVQQTQVSNAEGVRFEHLDSLAKLYALVEWADVVQVNATFSLRPGTMTAMRHLTKVGKRFVVALRTTMGHLPFSALASQSNFAQQALLDDFAAYLNHPNCFVVGPSEAVLDSLKFLGVGKKLHVVHNAKDWSAFSGVDEKVQKVDILYAGEISWMKGLHVLLGAYAIVRENMPNVTLRLVGGGQNYNDVKAILTSLFGTDGWEMIGYVPNKSMSAQLQSTRVLVMPSLTESWGNIGMEAMGLGVPLIASDIEGLRELGEDGAKATLFKRGDPQALANALLQFFNGAPFGEVQKGKLARYIQDKYSMKHRVESLLETYKEIVS